MYVCRRYAETFETMKGIVGCLQTMGIPRGSFIGLCAHNSLPHVQIILALMVGGYVAVPMSLHLSESNARHIAFEAQLRAVFVSPATVDRFDKFAGEVAAPSVPFRVFNCLDGAVESLASWVGEHGNVHLAQFVALPPSSLGSSSSSSSSGSSSSSDQIVGSGGGASGAGGGAAAGAVSAAGPTAGAGEPFSAIRDCPGRHGLVAFEVVEDGWECDGCDMAVPEGTVIKGCRTCDYDVCEACASSGTMPTASVHSQTPSPPPPHYEGAIAGGDIFGAESAWCVLRITSEARKVRSMTRWVRTKIKGRRGGKDPRAEQEAFGRWQINGYIEDVLVQWSNGGTLEACCMGEEGENRGRKGCVHCMYTNR